jgi:hypothetical protein
MALWRNRQLSLATPPAIPATTFTTSPSHAGPCQLPGRPADEHAGGPLRVEEAPLTVNSFLSPSRTHRERCADRGLSSCRFAQTEST